MGNFRGEIGSRIENLAAVAMNSPKGIAVVTGGNRGIGIEVCRQLAEDGVRVILTARIRGEGLKAAKKLQRQGLDVACQPLDVSDPASIAAFAGQMRDREPPVDILVNNAGVSLKGFNGSVVRRTMAVNFFGAMHLTDAMLPSMPRDARIVMVSSEMGSLSCLSPVRQTEFLDPALTRDRLIALVDDYYRDVEQGRHRAGGWPTSAYSVSKVALNALTRILAKELEGSGTLVNAIGPGWVRTRMGGRSAPRSVAVGASGIAWAATLPADGPNGGFFSDRKSIPW